MSSVQPITPEPWVRPRLENVTYRSQNPALSLLLLSPDRATIYASAAGAVYKSTDDGASFTQLYAASGDTPLTAGVQSMYNLPDGATLVGNKVGGSSGSGLWRAEGFDTPGVTWSRAQLDTGGDLVMSRADNYVHEAWGVSVAPAGHPREGLVVATEYGPQTSDPGLGDVPKVWLSTDYGRTFRVILALTTFLTTRTNQHMHSVCFDPYTGAILASFGDGTGGGGRTGTIECRDYDDPSPTWTWVHGPRPDALFQATPMYATPGGIVLGSDGYPPGVFRIPTRADGTYGALQSTAGFGGGTTAVAIGLSAVENGGIVLLSHQRVDNNPSDGKIHGATPDGSRFFELWADSAPGQLDNPEVLAVGPTASGKIVASIANDGRVSAPARTIMSGDLVFP